MKDLLIRAASGVLYVTILIGSLFVSKLTFIAVIFVLGAITCIEYSRLRKLQWWLALPLLTIVFVALHFLDLWPQLKFVFASLAVVVNCYLIYWLFNKKASISNLFARVILITTIVCGIASISLIPSDGILYYKEAMIAVLTMLWINDSFAYLVGKNFGRNKLMPSVSPNKTIEGFIGGAIAAVVAGIGFWYFSESFSLISWVILALLVVIFGSLGDLIQSRFKRIAGVKDSGVIMPGHGGMYDRLDSLIFAAPFVYLFLILVCYVP